MRRFAVASLSVLALGAGPLASAVDAGQPRAQLRAFVCKRAISPGRRAISVTAVMRPMTGTKRMQLKFELLERLAGTSGASEVTGGDLGSWLSPSKATLGSRPGDVWILRHPVKDLAGPAHYRFRVTFRWKGAHGRVLGNVVRLGRDCNEPELGPDLAVKSLTARSIAGHPNAQQYVAKIVNDGASAAGPFEIWFTYGTTVVKRSEPGLPSHHKLTETFTGPLCTTADPPSVTADATNSVGDSNRANNTLAATCS